MEYTNISAYTPSNVGYYPPYVSINYKEEGIEIIVRSPKNEDGTCGRTSSMIIPHNQFEILLDQTNNRYAEIRNK